MYLRQYETVILVDPDSGQDGIDKVLERTRDAFKKTQAQEIRVENWGVRKLAYILNRRKTGTYLYLQFLGSNATVAELERLLKILEPAFKYQTLVINPQVDPTSFDFKAAGGEQTTLARKAVEAAEAKVAKEKEDAERAASQPDPEVEEPVAAPVVEENTDVEAEAAPNVEAKAAPKAEAKAAPKAEAKAEAKAAPKAAPKAEAKVEVKAAPKVEAVVAEEADATPEVEQAEEAPEAGAENTEETE
jgi:small subunit ribosomal protein S6